jgi:hypothetical protein
MSWDKAENRSKQAGEGSFIRLADDGDKFVGIFQGEPHVRELIWNEKKNAYEDFDAKTNEGKSSTPKYKLNVFVISEKKMKIFEMNNATFKDVLKCRDKYGLDNWAFEVTRNGKKGDTKTTYSVLPDTKVDALAADVLAAFKAAKPHDLAKAKDEEDASTDMKSHDKAKNGAAPAADADIEGTDDAAQIIARLKVLPREKLQGFMTKFGVTQIKRLKAKDLKAAYEELALLEGKPATTPEKPAEEDPFT